MTNITMDFYESIGVKFLEKSGNGILCEYQDKDYKFYPSNPYKLYNKAGDLDFKRKLRSTKAWKVSYGNHVDDLMLDLFEKDDKTLYQTVVCTQNLENHSKEVKAFLDTYDILKVQSPMATRKSNIIQEILNQCDERNQRVIMITNRVSLARDISIKYNIDNYQDIQYSEGHLVCQFDSLHRFDVQDFDVLVIDEVSSLLNYCTSKHGDVDNHKMNVIRLMGLGTHKKLAMLDAFIIDYPWKNRTEIGILNTFREKHSVFIYDHKTTFLNTIMNDVRNKRNISVSSNEKGFLERISTKLKELNVRHVLLTGKTPIKERDTIYKAFQDRNLDVPVILYSPVLTVGVSIYSEKIENHYHYDVGGTTSTIDSIQMIRRSRNAKKIHIFLRARSAILSTEIENIEYNLVDFTEIDDFGNRISISRSGKMFAEVKLMSNIMTNSSKYALLHLLEYQFTNYQQITRTF